jgi:hypothetical protein
VPCTGSRKTGTRANVERDGMRLGRWAEKEWQWDMEGFIDHIENATEDNSHFRRVVYTGEHLQLVLMSIAPGTTSRTPAKSPSSCIRSTARLIIATDTWLPQKMKQSRRVKNSTARPRKNELPKSLPKGLCRGTTRCSDRVSSMTAERPLEAVIGPAGASPQPAGLSTPRTRASSSKDSRMSLDIALVVRSFCRTH